MRSWGQSSSRCVIVVVQWCGPACVTVRASFARLRGAPLSGCIKPLPFCGPPRRVSSRVTCCVLGCCRMRFVTCQSRWRQRLAVRACSLPRALAFVLALLCTVPACEYHGFHTLWLARCVRCATLAEGDVVVAGATQQDRLLCPITRVRFAAPVHRYVLSCPWRVRALRTQRVSALWSSFFARGVRTTRACIHVCSAHAHACS